LTQQINVASQLTTANTNLKYWRSIASGEKTVKLDDALMKNSLINPQNAYETNMKTVNELRLHYLRGQHFDETMLITLENLVTQCYEEAGPAIYFAYSFLPECRRPDKFPNKCVSGRSDNFASVTDQSNEISLFPNPANNQLVLQNIDPAIHPISAVIYNNHGQKAYEIVLQSRNTIDISYLEKGIYFMQLFNSNGILKVLPFIKQ